MSYTASRRFDLDSKMDFRLLFLEDSHLDTTQPVTSSTNTNSTSNSSSSSTSTDARLDLPDIDNLNDLERLLTRINLMMGRNTVAPRYTTRRSIARLPIRSVKKLPGAILSSSAQEVSRNLPPPTISLPQKITWYSLPAELQLRIYHHYFNKTHYTIHDSSATTTCLTRSTSIFWKNTTSPSRTIHSSHINLFLTSREIIYTVHPIWLSTSTFSFANCIVRDPKVTLWQMKIPQNLLAQVKTFEADKEKVISLIKVLAQWKKRIGIADGVGTAFGREEVPFMLRCLGDVSEFGTFEVFSELYRGGLYGMRLEYVGRSMEMEQEQVEREWLKDSGYPVGSL